MRIVKFLSKTRLDPAISSVTLRIIGISLMLSSLSSEEAGMSGPDLIYFAFGLMLWSEGMLPRRKDGP